jgi:hypothetical protein
LSKYLPIQKRICRSLIYLLLSVLALSACLTASGGNDATTTVTRPTLKQTYTQADDPMHGRGFSTDVPTTVPTMVRSTTPTRTLSEAEKSPTPYPTLPMDERAVSFGALLAGDGVCDLPCLWGITPGESTWTDVKNQLSPLGTVHLYNRTGYFTGFAPREMDRITATLPPDYVYGKIDLAFILDGDRVIAIIINSRWVSENFDYSLSSLLHYFGKPDEIWIDLMPKTMGESGPLYRIDIFYKQKGMISFNGKGNVKGSTFTFCPQQLTSYDNYPPYLYFWGDNEAADFSTSDILQQGNPLYRDDFHRITDLSSSPKDEAEFYDLYSKPGAKDCVVVQMDDK